MSDFKDLADTKRDRNITCPQCKKNNKDGKYSHFKGRPLDEGKCFSCDYFKYNGNVNYTDNYSPKYSPKLVYNYIPSDVINSNRLRIEDSSSLTNYLLKYFDRNKVEKVINDYYVCKGPEAGTVGFPLIDVNRNARRMQYMKFYFDGNVCRRTNYNNWYKIAQQYDRCLFGEHWLSNDKDSEVCVIESQRACLYMKLYDPSREWLGTGGKSNLQDELFNRLDYKEVRLIPDVDALELWDRRADELCKKYPKIKFRVDDICYLNKNKIGPKGDIEDLVLSTFAQR